MSDIAEAQQEVDRQREIVEDIQRQIKDELSNSYPDQGLIDDLKGNLRIALYSLKEAEWYLRKITH